MTPSLDTMLDLLTDDMWKELGPLDPNWFDTLTAHPVPHEVKDPDELCANQEGHFKIPFNNSADESQLFSTPRAFRHAHLSSVETEDESEIDAEPGKAFWTAKSPDLYEPRTREPVLKYGVNIPLRSQDTFNLLHTPQKLESSYCKAISESLGVNVQADISWTSSFNTPTAVPSTLILSYPEESPRPMRLSEEKDVVIVRTLFPSLSNPSRVGPPAPPVAPFGRDAEPARTLKSQDSPDVELDPSYCDSKQKSPVANQDEGFGVSENTPDAFLPNSHFSLRKVKTAKRSKIDLAKVQRCIPTLTGLEASEPRSVSKKLDKAPELKSPLNSEDGNTQWSPLSLSGVPLSVGETCHNPAAGEETAAVRQKQSMSFTHTGSSKKKRTFIYTVKQAAARVLEKQTPSCRTGSSTGQDAAGNSNPRPTGELECSQVRNAVAEGSGEMLPPEPVVGKTLPLSAHDLDMSQLNRVFAQDFSQMLSLYKPHSAAEGSTQNGFSPSLCLTALRLAKQKARPSDFDCSDAGRTPKSKANLSCVTGDLSIADSGFQSVAPDVSFTTNMPSAGETSQSKMSLRSTINGGGFLGESKLTCIANESEARSTGEASKSGPTGFKTASNKGIIISSANLEKARRLLEEFEGEASQVGGPPMDCISGPKDQRSGDPEMSSRFDQDTKCQLTASQKADVTELCSLLEEAESQFEFTARQPCEDPGPPLDADFLSGIDFDDSFSSEQDKPVITERSSMASHQSAFRSEASEHASAAETSGPFMRGSKECLREAKALLQDLSEDSHQNLQTKKSTDLVSDGDLLRQKSCPTKEEDHSNGFQLASGRGISISATALGKASSFFKDVDDTEAVEAVKASTCLVNGRPGVPDVKKELDHSEEAVSHRYRSSRNSASLSATLKNSAPCASESVGFSTASGKKVSVSASAISKARGLLDEVQTEGNINEPVRSDNWRNESHAHQSSGFQISADEAAADSSLPGDKPKSLLKDSSAIVDETKASAAQATDRGEGFQMGSWEQVGFSAPKQLSNDISAGSVTKNDDASQIHHSRESHRDSAAALDEHSVKANDLFKDSNGFPAAEMDGIDEFFNDSEVMDVMDCAPVRNGRRNHVEETGLSLTANNGPIDGQSNSIVKPPGFLDDDTKPDDSSLSCGIQASFSDEVILAALTLKEEKTNDQRANATRYGGFKRASGKSVSVSAAALQKAKSLFDNLDDKLGRGDDEAYTPTTEPVMAPPSTSSMKAFPGGFCTASGKDVTISEDALSKARALLKDSIDEEACEEFKHEDQLPPQQAGGTLESNSKESAGVVQEHPVFRKPLSPPSARPSVSSVRAGFAKASGKKVTVSGKAVAKAQSLLHHCPDSNAELKGDHLIPQGGFQTASGKGVSFSSAALTKARSLFSDCDGDDDTKCGQLKMNKDSSLFESPFNHGFSMAAGQKVSESDDAMEKASRLLNEGQFQNSHLKHEEDVLPQGGFQTASGKGVSFSAAALKKAKSLFSECEGVDASRSADFRVDDKPAGFSSASGKTVGLSAQALQKAKALFDDICVENMSLAEETPVPDQRATMVVDGTLRREDVGGEESPCKTAVLLTSSVSLTKEDPTDVTTSFLGAQSSNIPTSDQSVVISLNLNGCSETQQEYLAQEALDCTKALLMDESHGDLSMTLENMPQQQRKAALEEGFSKKRFREEQDVTAAHPPLKRRLLEEFDRTVDASQAFDLHPEKHCPTDRRVSLPGGALHPYVTKPDRDGRNYSESSLQRSSAIDVKSSAGVSSFVPPFLRKAKKEVERNCGSASVTPAFVPPFKRPPAQVSSSEAREELCGAPFSVKHYQPPAKKVGMKAASEAGNTNNEVDHSAEREPETGPSDVTLESIQLAHSMQEMRIRKKRRQTIRPQPGSVFMTRTSGAPRLTWRTAMGGKAPAKYFAHQLYEHGVAPHVAEISSESAESFRFSLQHFLKQEAFEDDGGVQLADGGWLVPCRNGTAGKVEFYRALCDTPGVDPKLISEEWVFNHYRWVVWKLASVERSFPQTMGSSCLTPEQVLLQLKYRYDVEVDNSRRPALRRIMEKDDTPAKTLVLCVCGVVSRGQSPARQRISEVKAPQDRSRCAVVWLTDGWYSIKAQLDEPLTAMLHKGRLAVGGKLIITGAQMLGSQEACCPLEAPESLMLKIGANSVRPARWDTKLGFYKDPRPFLLPLASLFHDGGPVGCVDVVVLRIYPTQWMERKNGGTVVFRSARAEEREARRFSAHKQKAMEVLFAKIQADFENEEKANKNSRRRTRTVTRRDLERLQDGEELYETVGDDLEARLSSQQLETLQTYKRSLMEKKQAELQDRCRRALEESDKQEGGCPQREVTPVWRISVADCVNPTGQVFQLSFWRPSSDLQSSLKEGSRYRVFNLMTSEGKKRIDSASVQLTSTKKTHIQEVQTSERLLAACFQPRVCVRFSDLQDPEFTSLCGEVDLAGKVVSVVDAQGPSPAFFLADSELNFIKVRCFSSLAECGLAELVKPGVLLALSNLQLRGQSNVPTPVVYSGDLTVFSTNPKETHLRESIERLQNQIQDDFLLKAEEKLSILINGPRAISSPAPPIPASVSHADIKTGMPVRGPGSATPVSRTPAPTNTSTEKDPRSLKRRRALDYLCRIPSPPPLSHLGSLSSPCVKKTFNPPRRSGISSTLRPQHSTPASKPVLAPAEDEWVNDEELAMIDTQALL